VPEAGCKDIRIRYIKFVVRVSFTLTLFNWNKQPPPPPPPPPFDGL